VVAIKTLQSKSRSISSPSSAEGTRESGSEESRQSENGDKSVLNRRVLEELGIAVNMRHRNIISTHEVIVETDRTCYMVMEACAVDLLTLIQGRQQQQTTASAMLLPRDKSAMDGYFVQLVQGVHYLHSIGVGHRDLKLDNICVTEQGVLKIVDFGCATLFRRRIQQQLQSKGAGGYGPARMTTAPRTRAAPYSVPSSNHTQTAKGTTNDHQYVETMSFGICGSDPYMAPELFDNSYYMAPKADIWALGIIYFAMQNQQFPWAVAQASRDAHYRGYEKAPDAFVAAWFSEPSEDREGGDGGDGLRSQGVNFLNMTQKRCHPNDTAATAGYEEHSASVARIVRRMLDTNPASRADINEVVNGPWVRSIKPSL
ncbi:serine/threonine protein kinase, partial [Coemansia sp. RSA 1933]